MNKIPTVNIHPTSARLLETGHYWITEDTFTKQFPSKEKWLIGKFQGKDICLFFHDPTHKSIKGRKWGVQNTINFSEELKVRMLSAIKKRTITDRENFYLAFGEADELPGLFILNLGTTILVQYFSLFWQEYLNLVVESLESHLPHIKSYWTQSRGIGEKKPATFFKGEKAHTFNLKEFDTFYKIQLDQFYDHGLYTDMAALRLKLKPHLSDAKSFLNLYCYTGAFSLYALGLKIDHVTSIDLSNVYLEWLQENIKPNPSIHPDSHQSLNMSSLQALKELAKNEKTFDFILCDPPSASSDGQKMSNALQEYEKLIPEMAKILLPKGKMLLFLNTHHVTLKKFENKILSILKENKLDHSLKLHSHWGLSDDCKTQKGFPEGNYLKGILLHKKV